MSLQALTQQAKKLSRLRVEVSKVQSPLNDRSWCLLMTLSNLPLRSTTQTFAVRWNRRGLTLSHQRCSKGARAICLGTRFHFDDIHATLFVPKNNWKQIVQKAVITDADGRQRSYWPEFWSMKYLNERKSEIDRVAFAYQYLNTAVRNADVGISPELIVKGVVPEDYDCLGVGIDLSAGLE